MSRPLHTFTLEQPHERFLPAIKKASETARARLYEAAQLVRTMPGNENAALVLADRIDAYVKSRGQTPPRRVRGVQTEDAL